MEHIFRPPVDVAGHDAKQVFHGESGAYPMVGFHFGERDQQIAAEDGFGQVDAYELGLRPAITV